MGNKQLIKNKQTIRAFCLILATLFLSACGGGGGGDPAPPPPPANVAPTANAGSDQTVDSNSGTITLTGSGTDTDGTITNYSWSTGSTITITNGDSATATFSAPTLNFGDADLELTFTLTVTDDDGATATDDVIIVVTAPTGPSSVVDSPWNIINYAPAASKVVFTGSKYIGVGSYITESTDGQTWTFVDLGERISFDEIAFNGNNVVVINASAGSVGNTARMGITIDGTSWQFVSNAENPDCTKISSITHDGSQFVGIFNSVNICTSADGVDWQLQSTQGLSMQKIVFGSNKYAILIAGGLMTIDSLTSTAANVPSLPLSSSGDLKDLIYANSTFVGLREGEIIYSADGATWSAVSGATVPANVISISYSTNKGFVAMNNDTTTTLLYSSTDGMSWSQITSDLPSLAGWFGKIVNGAVETLLFSHDSNIYSSSDLVTWNIISLVNQPTDYIHNYFKHNNTLFVVGSGSGSELKISTDNGISWTLADVPVSFIRSIIHDGTQFIASGDGIATSTDGITWTNIFSYDMARPVLASTQLGSTTYNFTYTGNFDSQKTVLTSDDGIEFQVDAGLNAAIPSNFLGGVKQATSNSAILVGITNNTIINFDGSVWGAPEQAISTNLTDVIWSGSRFVVVGASGLVMTSVDGKVWVTQSWINSTQTITDVLAVGTDLYATDNSGIVASSSDNGVTWIERKNFGTSGNKIGQLAHDGTSFYGFGWNSGLNQATLATSPDGILWGASSALFNVTIPAHHISYESSNSRFVSAYYANGEIYASNNAASWALTTQIPTDASYTYIATQKAVAPLRYGPLNLAAGVYTSGSAVYSNDGLNWIIKTNQMFYPGYTPQGGIYASGYGTGFDIGTKNGSYGKILVADDGINYVDAVLNGLTSNNIEFSFIKYLNNQYVGVQINTDTNNPGVYTSPDGSNWTLQTEGDFNPLWGGLVSDIEHDGTQYLLLFNNEKGAMILKTTALQNFTFIETGIRSYMDDLIIEANGYVLTGTNAIIATHAFY